MRKVRFSFVKTGTAVFISHLDLMRCLQRGMTRAKIPAWHTEGFNPHPFISLCAALSVGYHSDCELADIRIDDESFPLDTVPRRMNPALPEGISILSCYESGSPAKLIEYAGYEIGWNAGENAESEAARAQRIFSAESLVLLKKSKRGEKETDIIPMIRLLGAVCEGNRVVLRTVLACGQQASLNPEMLLRAVGREVGYAGLQIRRTGFFDGRMVPFR